LPTPPLEDANVSIMQCLKYQFVQMWIWVSAQDNK
jgi:hypothetical protein